jgi:hypothetical protein
MKLPRTRTLSTLIWLKIVLAEISKYTTKYQDLFDETEYDWSEELDGKAEHLVTTLKTIHRDEVSLKSGSNPARMLLFVEDIIVYITEILEFASVNVTGQHLLETHHKFVEWQTSDNELRVVKSKIVSLLQYSHTFFTH